MTGSTPMSRLRERHRREYSSLMAGPWCRECTCTWPCDVVAALDALEAELTETRSVATSHYMQLRNLGVKNADMGNETVDALQARLDAATVLIWGAQMDEHMNHGASLKRAALRACEHPNCAPYRAWLAGDKEES